MVIQKYLSRVKASIQQTVAKLTKQAPVLSANLYFRLIPERLK